MRLFFREEGGKQRLKKANAGVVLFVIAAMSLAWGILPKGEDTSFVGRSAKSLRDGGSGKKPDAGSEQSPHGIQGEEDASRDSRYQARQRSGGGGGGVKYRAVQIVNRPGGDPGQRLPIGTSFIGKLLSGIDTREAGALVRVLVPYGASFDYDRKIDKNSVLFGTTSYSGSGDKVYVKFNRVLFPDGREFKVEAEALSSSDYTAGLSGEENDGAGGRIGTTVGLKMLSGITDTLVEKESLSQFGEPTAKSSLRNGFMNGMNKATEEEAQRRAAKIRNAPDYVTIEAGRDLIVSLIETFKGEPL